MQSPVHYLPILTTLFSAWFAPQLLARWGARRPSPHLFWWGVGVVAYGAGTVVESLTTLFGWHEWLFRTWYITGALLGGAPLATGTAYLLFRARTAHILTTLLVLAITIASVGVALSPIDTALVEPYRLSGQVLVWHWERLFAPFINTYALIVLVGGAIYSAWTFYRRPGMERRGLANVYIAVGGLLPGIGGSFAHYNMVEVLYVAEFIGILLIYAGYRIAISEG
jgi:hypothetical protein